MSWKAVVGWNILAYNSIEEIIERFKAGEQRLIVYVSEPCSKPLLVACGPVVIEVEHVGCIHRVVKRI